MPLQILNAGVCHGLLGRLYREAISAVQGMTIWGFLERGCRSLRFRGLDSRGGTHDAPDPEGDSAQRLHGWFGQIFVANGFTTLFRFPNQRARRRLRAAGRSSGLVGIPWNRVAVRGIAVSGAEKFSKRYCTELFSG